MKNWQKKKFSSLTRNLVSDSYIYLLNTKMRLTMLCSNGFELYSRWLPLVSVWLRSKKRGTRVKDRVKNGAHIGVGTPTSSPGRFSLALGAGRESALGTRLWGHPPRACSHFPIYWLEKNFFSNSLCTYQLLHVFCQHKRFFSRFRATSQEQENKLAMHSGIAAYKKKNSSFTYRRRFPFSDLT